MDELEGGICGGDGGACGGGVSVGGCAGADGASEQFGLSGGRHRAWGALLMAHARATERVGRRVEAEGGLPLDWYDVLLVLEYAPERRLRMGELAEHVLLSRSGLTRLIDRIEAAGLVERHLCPSDRRAFEAVLTDKGHAAREQSWPIYARAIADGFGSRYSEEEAQHLAGLLARQVAPEPAAN
jgi:DNA-binding MarR family transcriptional regulator